MDFLSEGEDVYREWRSMVALHNVLGAQVHDARLAATMMVHGIRHLLTFNTGDFKRYSSIVVIQPKEIIEESR